MPLLRAGPRPADDGESTVTIDMTGLTFVSPLDLTAIAAIADAAILRGQSVRLICPADASVASYIERMDLLTQFDARVSVEAQPAAGARADSTQVLVELTRVTSSDAASVLGSSFGDLAEAQFGSGALALFKCLGELLDNAASHGKSLGGGFAAAQYYTGTTSGRHGLELAVSDNGAGVLGHLGRRYKNLATDRAALEAAVRGPVSGLAETGRGWGLHDIVQLTGAASRAAFVLASGQTALYKSQRDGRLVTKLTPLAAPIEGTWAWLRVRLPKPDQ
jgi:anti-anti-sigma regulatory factor